MTILCERCDKTFEIGFLNIQFWSWFSDNNLGYTRLWSVTLLLEISLFSNGKVPGLKHTPPPIYWAQANVSLSRRPLREANQPNHLLLNLRSSGVKILLPHVTLLNAKSTLCANILNTFLTFEDWNRWTYIYFFM
jgi:hypothetical protein